MWSTRSVRCVASCSLTSLPQCSSQTLHEHLSELFRLLLDSQSPPLPNDSVSGSVSATGSVSTARQASLSRAGSSLRGMRTMQIQASRSRVLGPEDGAGRHVEQLLLRLDFNGVLTRQEEVGGRVLPPRVG